MDSDLNNLFIFLGLLIIYNDFKRVIMVLFGKKSRGVLLVTVFSLVLTSAVLISGLPQRQILEKKAQGATPILTVGTEVVGQTSKMLIGQAALQDLIWATKDPRFVNLVKEIRPGISRFPHHRYFWQRSSSINAWLNGWNTWGNYTIGLVDKRLHAIVPDTLEAAEASRGVYQRYLPTQFVPGQTYCLTFQYEGKNILDTFLRVRNGQTERVTTDRRGAFLNIYYYESEPWFVNGTGFLRGVVPAGNSQGQFTGTIGQPNCKVYTPDPARNVAFVQLELALGSGGEMWLDNVAVTQVGSTGSPTGPNVTVDGTFDGTLYPNREGLDAPFAGQNVNFTHRFTSKSMDDFVSFFRQVGVEPLFQWNMVDAINPQAANPGDPQSVENAVLNHPLLNTVLDREVDIVRYTNIEKGYGVKYWELMNEPEIMWTWANGAYNAGTNSQAVYNRYKLYGRLFSKLVQKAKVVDPTIKPVAAIINGPFFKSSIDGLVDGIRQEGGQLPEYYAPHPYQVFAWTGSCPGDTRACIDNLLTYGAARCVNGNIENSGDWNKMSFFDAYFQCSKTYLQGKGVPDPKFIPTEWEASGDSETPEATFGDEVWVADRLGRFAKLGVFAPLHWHLGSRFLSDYGKVDSPFATFYYYSKFLERPTKVLRATTNLDDQVTIYAFQENATSPVHLVMVNLKKEDGTTAVQLNLPAGFVNSQASQYLINCSGTGCLYNRSVAEVNGTRIPTIGTQALSTLASVQSTRVPVNSSSISFNFPNHSTIFWEIPLGGIRGDANKDGVVNLSDNTCLRNDFWKTGGFSCSDSDLNRDGRVGIIDSNIFFSAFLK